MQRKLTLLVAASLACVAVHGQELSIPVPDRLDTAQCRPINVGADEMDRQWRLYYSHTNELRRSPTLERVERDDANEQKMTTTLNECFVGSKLFAAVCFSRASTKSLLIQSVKLVHAPKGGNCISIVSVRRK